MPKKKSQIKKIIITGVTDSEFDVIGGDSITGATSDIRPSSHSKGDLEIRIKDLEKYRGRIIAGNEINYSNLQSALEVIENIATQKIQADHVEELKRLTSSIRTESQKKSPDWNLIRDWINKILTIFSLAKLDPTIFEKIKAFFEQILGGIL